MTTLNTILALLILTASAHVANNSLNELAAIQAPQASHGLVMASVEVSK